MRRSRPPAAVRAGEERRARRMIQPPVADRVSPPRPGLLDEHEEPCRRSRPVQLVAPPLGRRRATLAPAHGLTAIDVQSSAGTTTLSSRSVATRSTTASASPGSDETTWAPPPTSRRSAAATPESNRKRAGRQLERRAGAGLRHARREPVTKSNPSLRPDGTRRGDLCERGDGQRPRSRRERAPQLSGDSLRVDLERVRPEGVDRRLEVVGKRRRRHRGRDRAGASAAARRRRPRAPRSPRPGHAA